MPEPVIIKVGADLSELTAKLDSLQSQFDEFKGAAKQSGEAVKQAFTGQAVSATKDLSKSMDGVKMSAKQLDAEIRAVNESIKKTNDPKAIAALKEYRQELIAEEAQLGKTTQKFESMRGKIMAIKNELFKLRAEGKQGTVRFQELTTELGRLGDMKDDINELGKAMSSDTRHIDGMIQGVQGLVGAFSIFQGVQMLVGSENKEFQQAMMKMMATMQILNGVQQVANILQKESSFMQTLNAAATKLQTLLTVQQTAATVTNTGATIADTAATNANTLAKTASKGVIGLIVVAISALVSAMAAVTKIQEKRAAQVIKEMSMSEDQLEMYRQLTQARKKGLETTAQEVVSAEILFKATEKTVAGSKERKKSINDINTAYGAYLPNLLTEKSSLTDIAAAHRLIADGIKAKLQAEVETEAAKKYVQRDAQLQAEKKNYEDQIKLINDYNRAKLDYDTRAQAGTLKPFELAPELPAQVATLGTAYQALEKIEPKLEAVTIAIGANDSAMKLAISSAAKAAAKFNLLTYEHGKSKEATEESTEKQIKYKESLDLVIQAEEKLAKERDKNAKKETETFVFDPESIKEQYQIKLRLSKEGEKEHTEALIQLERLRYFEAQSAAKGNAETLRLIEKEHTENEKKIYSDAEEFKTKKQKEEQAKRLELISGEVNRWLGALTNAIDIYLKFEQQQTDQQLNNINKVYDAKTEKNKTALDKGLISQEQFNKESEKLEKDKANKERKIRREAWEKEKKAALAKAAINIALGVVSSLSGPPKYKWIEMGLVIAAGAAEMALIASAKNPYRKGTAQILQGNSHEGGGISLGQFGTAEGGEMLGILSKNKTKKFGKPMMDLFDGINKGNDSKMLKGLSGLVISAMPEIKQGNQVVNVPKQPELGQMLDIMRQPTETVTIQGNRKIIKKGNYTKIVHI